MFTIYNGQILRNSDGIYFQSEETRTFKVSRRSSFLELKDRIVKKYHSGMEVSDIIYRNPIFFGNDTTQFEPLKILDDANVKVMFDIHSQNNITSIELCVDLKERQPSSNIFYPSTSSQPFPSQETQTFHDHFDPSSSQINIDQPPH
jgi:hypothetical protein